MGETGFRKAAGELSSCYVIYQADMEFKQEGILKMFYFPEPVLSNPNSAKASMEGLAEVGNTLNRLTRAVKPRYLTRVTMRRAAS